MNSEKMLKINLSYKNKDIELSFNLIKLKFFS